MDLLLEGACRIYDYASDRGSEAPQAILDGTQGTLTIDDCSAYSDVTGAQRKRIGFSRPPAVIYSTRFATIEAP